MKRIKTNPCDLSEISYWKAAKSGAELDLQHTVHVHVFDDTDVKHIYVPTESNYFDTSLPLDEQPGWTDDLADALDEYTKYGISSRSKNKEFSDGVTHYGIDHMLKNLNKLHPNFRGFVYRGGRFTLTQIDKLTTLEEGDIIYNDSILSASWDPYVSAGFIKDFGYHHSNTSREPKYPAFIYIKTKGYDISEVSNYPDEKEILVDADTYYQFMDVTNRDGIAHVVLEEVDKEVINSMQSINPEFKIHKDILTFVGLSAAGGVVSKSEANEVLPHPILNKKMYIEEAHTLTDKILGSKDPYKRAIELLEMGNNKHKVDIDVNGELILPNGASALRYPELKKYNKGNKVPSAIINVYTEKDRQANLETLNRVVGDDAFSKLSENQKVALMLSLHNGGLGPKAIELLKEGKGNSQEFWDEAFGKKSSVYVKKTPYPGLAKRRYIEGLIYKN